MEVRRRTRPMVCFVNVESVDRIIYSIFQRFNLEWKTRTLSVFTQGLDVTPRSSGFCTNLGARMIYGCSEEACAYVRLSFC